MAQRLQGVPQHAYASAAPPCRSCTSPTLAAHLTSALPAPCPPAAEAGKFPLLQLYQEGHARVLRDRGFASSQDAVLPDVWFEAGARDGRSAAAGLVRLVQRGCNERVCPNAPQRNAPAGDMHGAPDDGYPVLPAAGFAPFAFMLQRHVPWADERLRGSYYQRAWQAMAARVMGLRHFVVPNAFAMQLPHPDAYDRAEARIATFQAVRLGAGGASPNTGVHARCISLAAPTAHAHQSFAAPRPPPLACLQMEPVLRQLAAEAGTGTYVPVTSFAGMCAMAAARAAGSAH